MKTIHHTVFPSKSGARREQTRERVRRRVEDFINEIGVEKVVSVNEHAPMFGPFSIVVWWYGELPETETLVIRASGENETV
jgi:hypothetical protein